MSDAVFAFGTVFLHKEQHYVYFLEEDEMWYCARILDAEQKGKILRYSEQPIEKIGESHAVFCFVVLSTDQFRDEIAHLHNPQTSVPHFPTLAGELNTEDKKNLAEKIRNSGGMPKALKLFVEKLDL